MVIVIATISPRRKPIFSYHTFASNDDILSYKETVLSGDRFTLRFLMSNMLCLNVYEYYCVYNYLSLLTFIYI